MLFFALLIPFITSSTPSITSSTPDRNPVETFEKCVKIQDTRFEYGTNLIEEIAMKKASDEYIQIALNHQTTTQLPLNFHAVIDKHKDKLYYTKLTGDQVLFVLLNGDSSWIWIGNVLSTKITKKSLKNKNLLPNIFMS